MRRSGRLRAHVLVVSADGPEKRALLEALESEGFDAAEAASILEACAALRTARPALVVLDALLSDGRGLDLLEALRRDEDLRDVPVVVRGVAGGDAPREALRRGASALVRSDVPPAEILDVARGLGVRPARPAFPAPAEA